MAVPTEEERNDAAAIELYYQLRPAAIEAYDDYILSRTPAHLQPYMRVTLAPDLPKLMISDTQPVPIKDDQDPPQDVPGSPGIARADGAGGYIELVIPP